MWGRSSGMGTSGLTLPVTVGEIRGAMRGESRDTTLLPRSPTNGLVLELSRRKDGWRLLLVNVISKTTKFVLNLPEMIMNALIVTLSVAP
jgi:hypothetical protein